MRIAPTTVMFVILAAARLFAEDAVRPGRFIAEPPTIICLGFEWEIAGDDDRNAAVQVAYRASGSKEWKEGMPLLRMGGERVFGAAEHLDYTEASWTSSRTPPTKFASQ